MSERTPTPWIVRTQVRVGPYRGGHYLARNDTESATAWAKDEANAAFIVKAVNSHDALVKALRMQEDAELAHANCEECGGEEVPELCPKCFPLFDDARITRRLLIASIKERA